MDDITQVAKDCKKDMEIQKLYQTLQTTLLEVKRLTEENASLKQLVAATVPIIGENKVERVIVTPEEALIDTQINILEKRGRANTELTLEETKKLDLLLKNKKLIKEMNDSIPTEGKTINSNISKAQLIQLASKKLDSD